MAEPNLPADLADWKVFRRIVDSILDCVSDDIGDLALILNPDYNPDFHGSDDTVVTATEDAIWHLIAQTIDPIDPKDPS